MDMNKFKKLPVLFTVNDCVETEDSRFLAITIDVLHTGLNFNGSVLAERLLMRVPIALKTLRFLDILL